MRKVVVLVLGLLVSFFLVVESADAKVKKLSKKDRKALSSPLPFMTLNQVSLLDHKNRVKYVRELRKAFVAIEKAQFSFRNSQFIGASLERDNQRELYAFIMGQFAYAQTQQDLPFDGGRGMSCDDKCIHGYNISGYKDCGNGTQKPFLCQIPDNMRCENGGVYCNSLVSGLAPKKHCVPKAESWRSTQVCDEIRAELAEQNRTRVYGNGAINLLVQKSEEYFFSSVRSKQDLLSDEASRNLQNLLDTAYDDNSYAQLIRIMGLYLRSGIELPDKLTPIATEGSLTAEDFAESLVASEKVVNKMFNQYISHCNAELDQGRDDQKVLKKLKDPKWIEHVKSNLQGGAKALEQQRIEAAENYEVDKNPRPRVRDVLEIPECRNFFTRRDSLIRSFNDLRADYPELSDDAPEGRPVLPEAPASEALLASNGCRQSVSSEVDLLFQPAARCIICSAEKDVGGDYTPSSKWASLLSTMALACGEGVGNNSHVSPEMMLFYKQTFGHCSTETYEFDPDTESGRINRDDKRYERKIADQKLLEAWSKRDFWDTYKADKKNNKKVRKAARKGKDTDREYIDSPLLGDGFERIYGVSYEEAASIFCPGKEKNGVYTVNNPIKPFSDTNYNVNNSAAMAQRRQSVKDNYNRISVRSNTSRALKNCIGESLRIADNYALNSGKCYGYTTFDRLGDRCVDSSGATTTIASCLADDVKNNHTNIIFDATDCYVAIQVSRDSNTGTVATGYVSTGTLSLTADGPQTSNSRYLEIPTFPDGKSWPTQMAISTDGRKRTGVDDEGLKNYHIAYHPGPGANQYCPDPSAASGSSSNKSGKTK